jgi:hypothetical protein
VRLLQTAGALGDHLDEPDYRPAGGRLAFYCSNSKGPVPSTTRAECGGRWRSTPATCSSCASPMSAPPELKRRYEAFLAVNDIVVDGIELVSDRAGTTYAHDVNTKQSRSRRSRVPFRPMSTPARHLGADFDRLYFRGNSVA